ncbi:MAG: peptide chain release factor-like protein [bacterium]|nr:peptide chain release factor-like protein [bacterium]
MVGKDKWDKLRAWMQLLDVHEHDVVEQFILGSGKGGQKLQKTSSTIYLKHIPSKIEVKCQDSRSREDNRYYARLRICEKLHPTLRKDKTKEQQKIAKLKLQKKRRARRTKQKMHQSSGQNIESS